MNYEAFEIKERIKDRKRDRENEKDRILKSRGTRIPSKLEQNWNQPKVDLQMLVFWAGNKV